MSDVTRLLGAAQFGDRQAAAELLPLVYDELRRLASARMAAENPGHTLDATALVPEAYLRLVGDQQFEGRGHFFAAAAEAMRRILIESARRRQSQKRGGGQQRSDRDLDGLPAQDADDRLIALDDALTHLTETDPEVADLVRLRYFAGLSIPQAAAALGIAPRTADAWWAYARAWLRDALNAESPE